MVTEDNGQKRKKESLLEDKAKCHKEQSEELLPESREDLTEPGDSGFWVRCNNWTGRWVFSFEELVKITDSGGSFILKIKWVGLKWGPRVYIFNKQWSLDHTFKKSWSGGIWILYILQRRVLVLKSTYYLFLHQKVYIFVLGKFTFNPSLPFLLLFSLLKT